MCLCLCELSLTLSLLPLLPHPARSHFSLMPDVPIVGWDVAFTPQGIFLLEVNLSCNFFRGSFDIPSYVCFVDDFFRDLEQAEARGARGRGQGAGAGGEPL